MEGGAERCVLKFISWLKRVGRKWGERVGGGGLLSLVAAPKLSEMVNWIPVWDDVDWEQKIPTEEAERVSYRVREGGV